MWHYAQEGQRKGPVSDEVLRNLARDGGLAPSDLVWREGMSEWAPAAEATDFEFAPAAADAAPPAPAPVPAYAEPASYAQRPGSYDQGAATPYAPPSARIEPAGPAVTDYLPWSIAATILCCNFTGIVAIIFSVKTNSAKHYGDQQEIQRAGRLAKIWFWWTFGIGLTFWLVYLSFYVFVIAAGLSEL